jgi:hypothetical protein
MAAATLAACGASSGVSVSTAPPTTSPTTDAPIVTDAPVVTDAPTTVETVPTLPDPCSLVSQAQATAVVVIPLLGATRAGSGDDQYCQYGADPSGPVAQVEVFVGAGAKKILDLDKDTLQHEFTTLSGVGDEAYLEPGTLFLRKGTIWVAVEAVVLDTPPEQVQAALTALGPVIAGEL